MSQPEASISESQATSAVGGLPELLAPAGDAAALDAALAAGANAVYFGMRVLNARRRAPNFRPEEFAEAVDAAHRRGAKAYLTLNTDIAERELGQAVRLLELARQHGADAVLIRDPALMLLRPHFPQLEFHFSTQTCMANTADVTAARELGAARVVLARELTLDEIAAASAIPGVQTEVFVQGSLCFCVSGRCLMSSWVGGHSGNRGSCTSPCRVPWTTDDAPVGTPFSMRDLGTIERLPELRQTGVVALKIEGRLKNADWVRRAVSLYRRALDGESPATLRDEVSGLGAYTGRHLTSGYLDGEREGLTGLAAGRSAEAFTTSATAPLPVVAHEVCRCDGGAESLDEQEADEPDTIARGLSDEPRAAGRRSGSPTYDLTISLAGKGIEFRCECLEQIATWSVPKTVVRRAHKAVSVGQVLAYLEQFPVAGCALRRGTTDDTDFLMVPRATNALVAKLSTVIQHARKVREREFNVEMPRWLLAALEAAPPSPANRHPLGDPPDRARLDATAVAGFVTQVRPEAAIVEGITAETLRDVQRACQRVPLIVVLPAVFFEADLPGVRALLQQCARARLVVEANSWGGWRLAKEAGVRLEAGPGLAVLNSLAARQLVHCGAESVTLSVEADRRQLEQLTAACSAPCSLAIFGRPPLFVTRAQLDQQFLGQVFEDRRGVRLTPRRESGLWVFRPVQPFDLRTCRNERLRVRHLVVDLVGSPDPVSEWHDLQSRTASRFRFNYDRLLA